MTSPKILSKAEKIDAIKRDPKFEHFYSRVLQTYLELPEDKRGMMDVTEKMLGAKRGYLFVHAALKALSKNQVMAQKKMPECAGNFRYELLMQNVQERERIAEQLDKDMPDAAYFYELQHPKVRGR